MPPSWRRTWFRYEWCTKLKKVIFFNFPHTSMYNNGLLTLKPILQNKGIDVRIIQLFPLLDIKAIVKEINPDFIGFSLVSPFGYQNSLSFMRDAKKTGIPMMVGGPYVKMGGYIDSRFGDFICRGEAEKLSDFILEGDEDIFKNKYIHPDLNDLPLPSYEGITGYDMPGTGVYLPLNNIKRIPYLSSRGCPFFCSFCANQYEVCHPKVRFRRGVRNDIQSLYNHYSPDVVYIMDDLPPYYNEEWRAEMDGNKVPFMGGIRGDIEEKQLLFLIRNGLKITWFGVESGNEEYREKQYNKKIKNEQFYRTAAILKLHKINYFSFFIINGPYSSPENQFETIGMARGIGGIPVVWDYYHFPGKRFSISDEWISDCSQKCNLSEELLRDQFVYEQNYTISNEKGFATYRVESDGILGVQVYGPGNGEYWHEEVMPELCKKHNKKQWYAHTLIGDKLVGKHGITKYHDVIGRRVN